LELPLEFLDLSREVLEQFAQTPAMVEESGRLIL
jgi:hypothetical protein